MSNSVLSPSITGSPEGGEGEGQRGQPSAGPWHLPGWEACSHLQPDSILQLRSLWATAGWSDLRPSLKAASQVGRHDSSSPSQNLDLPRSDPMGPQGPGREAGEYSRAVGAEGARGRGAHGGGIRRGHGRGSPCPAALITHDPSGLGHSEPLRLVWGGLDSKPFPPTGRGQHGPRPGSPSRVLGRLVQRVGHRGLGRRPWPQTLACGGCLVCRRGLTGENAAP